MRVLIIFLLFSFSGKVYSSDNVLKESLPYSYCTVLKDSIDQNIPVGKIKISGTVFYASNNPVYGQFLKGDKQHSVKISMGNSGAFVISEDGNFSLVMDTALNYLTFELLEQENVRHELIYFENYSLKSQHVLNLKVEIPYHSEDYPITVDKPVVYMYSDSALNVALEVKTALKLNFVYPAFQKKNTWSVECSKAGLFVDNKQYPYLFWEAQTERIEFDREANELYGTIVRKEELLSFLEKNLEVLGLNAAEKTDFITYWVPKMLQNECSFIQFLVDDRCNTLAELLITPKPDTQRRIYMLYKEIPAGTAVDHVVQKFSPLQRIGFVLIEWGGSEVNSADL